jgi:hypothetical protein
LFWSCTICLKYKVFSKTLEYKPRIKSADKSYKHKNRKVSE